MSGGNYVRGLIGFVGVMGAGYGIMKWTTPTDEEFYNKLSPELKKQVDSHRQAAARKAAFAEQLEASSFSWIPFLPTKKAKQSADADAPVWATQAAQKARDSTPPQ
ncbi:hypothetical protein BCV69DRAFT_311259 [Microstroma glucosiphilum]|uniref:Cytochrome b mRNA-processing protein 4 n=1 Tax=Pseudomicrostroma glucosiphilum TaxID=1684307 RepID=A0A316UH00_9BASI|nr:hypothetical protein BCV69DRAFT_311259 [Pseudomicrostroma glucosiphilum]PWN22455.1 hypothetical protein BCV69DRAFT_311259 [Pseudomicrostroma glucosiphilum]